MTNNLIKETRELKGLCDAMHLLIEGTLAEDNQRLSHKALTLEGGIHQLSHVLRDRSKALFEMTLQSKTLKKADDKFNTSQG